MERYDPATLTPLLDSEGRALVARHREWWQRRGALTARVPTGALSDLWLPLADGTTASRDLDLTPDMLDLERLAGEPRDDGPLARYGDVFGAVTPYMRVPWVEAILGCPVHATIKGGSMRTRPIVGDWDAWHARRGAWHQGWFDALTALTELLARRSAGRRAVVQTLMRGPSDLAEAILGSEMMCLSLYDHPDEMTAFLETVTEAFLTILSAQLERIPRVEGGLVNTFGIWTPGTVVRTQCDASAFLSPAQYRRWFLPYDLRISEAVDVSTIHLHSGSLHTVPALLAQERPHAIQVMVDPEPGGPTLRALLPTLRDILAVKPLIVEAFLTDDEVRLLEDALPEDGRCIIQRDDEQANARG